MPITKKALVAGFRISQPEMGDMSEAVRSHLHIFWPILCVSLNGGKDVLTSHGNHNGTSLPFSVLVILGHKKDVIINGCFGKFIDGRFYKRRVLVSLDLLSTNVTNLVWRSMVSGEYRVAGMDTIIAELGIGNDSTSSMDTTESKSCTEPPRPTTNNQSVVNI